LNSSAIIAVLGATVAAPFAAVILKVAGAAWVLRTGSVVFVLGTLCAFGIPRAARVGSEETVDEREALHARSIVIAGIATAIVGSCQSAGMTNWSEVAASSTVHSAWPTCTADPKTAHLFGRCN